VDLVMDHNPNKWFINGYGLVLEKNRPWTPLHAMSKINQDNDDNYYNLTVSTSSSL
jgi:hypothetical protein